ncbi:hypothetical protein COBT_002429 [Conglomerata obtusa]
MNINLIEEHIIRMDNEQFVYYMFVNNFYQRFLVCSCSCSAAMKYEDSSSYAEGKCWRCYSFGCTKYHARRLIKVDSFFEEFRTDSRIFM